MTEHDSSTHSSPGTAAKFFRRFFMGLVIGIACITPGLSGGMIAASSGLYEPGLHALTHLHRDFRRGFRFLFPLGLGGLTGVFLFSNLMKFLMVRAPTTILYVFLGLVAGSLPSFLQEANRRGFRKRWLGVGFATFALVVFVEFLLGRVLPPAGLPLNMMTALLGGALIAVGTVIPGVSSSFLLIQLGIYEPFLEALTSFDLPILFSVAVGCGGVALVLVFAADWVFKRFHGVAYYAVLGFLAGSVVAVFPGFAKGLWVAVDVLLFAVSALGCWQLMRRTPPDRGETVPPQDSH